MKSTLLLVFGVILGALFIWFLKPGIASPLGDSAADSEKRIQALSDEIERLKGIAPTQSHVMADVGLQFSSLWFAAQQKNWDVANFLFNETRNRIRWTIRINPKPKAAGSQDEVDLQGLFDALDKDVLTPLKDSIAQKDSTKFEEMYRQTLVACYSCHKATNRPFLRPSMPSAPGLTVLNYDPKATWPQ